MHRAVVAVLIALGLVAAAAPAGSSSLQPTTMTSSYSTTTPAYDQPFTVTGQISPGGGLLSSRTVYLSTYVGGRWVIVRSGRVYGSTYSLSYHTTWLGTRKYLVWAPATSRYAAGYSQPVSVTHHKFASQTTAGLSTSPAIIGNGVVMRGRVTSYGEAAGRAVTLYRLFPNGWHRTERSATTGLDGGWSISVPNNFLTRSDLRVHVAGTESTNPVDSSRVRQTTEPTYFPAGYESQHAWLRGDDGIRWRWNGCRKEIAYRVNPGGLGSTFVSEVRTVAAQLQQATGIPFRYLGTTSAIPGSQRTWPSDTSLVVAYAWDGDTSWNLGSKIGLGGPTWGYKARDFSGTVWETKRAGVVLKKGWSWTAGFSGSHSRGQSLMHEMGHAMGLGHVGASSQVMYRTAVNHPRYGAGDLFGLMRVGYGLGGCTRALSGRVVATAAPAPTER